MTPLMVEEWLEIEDFPSYSVSNTGFVRNDHTGRKLSTLLTQRGAYVGLFRNMVQYNRSVKRLVANSFLPLPDLPHHRETFTTPIVLDGDYLNNDVRNLMWRPRWFAMQYCQQLRKNWTDTDEIIEIETGRRFLNTIEAATTYGLLPLDILAWTLNYDYWIKKNVAGVWPTGQRFRKKHNIPRQNRGV